MNVRSRNAQLLGIILLFLPVVQSASAGPYGDTLAKCLVKSTIPAERAAMLRWWFAMLSLHPDVKDVAAVTAEQRTAASKETARIVQRLLTESCPCETREAINAGGSDRCGGRLLRTGSSRNRRVGRIA